MGRRVAPALTHGEGQLGFGAQAGWMVAKGKDPLGLSFSPFYPLCPPPPLLFLAPLLFLSLWSHFSRS